jgi:TRAP-type C4-dicarboxylate transport system permease small subunit
MHQQFGVGSGKPLPTLSNGGQVQMDKLFRVVEWFSHYVSGVLMAGSIFVLMLMVLVEVVTRYIMNQPLSLADEYGGYMLVAMTMVGLAYTWKEKGHIYVDLVVNRLPDSLRMKLRLVTLMLAMILSVLLVVASWELVSQSFLFGARSGSWLRTPLAWPQMTLILGSVMLAAQLFVDIVRLVRSLTAAGGGR